MPDPGLPEPFRWDGGHVVADLPGARALFSTRRGGVSEGPFASLNLGERTGDAASSVEANQARLAAAVGVPWERIMLGRQVHGAAVARTTGTPARGAREHERDGQVTAVAGTAALVLVADCLPVVLSSDRGVAALHCGWRGLAAGIVAEGARVLRGLGTESGLSAAVGPGARGCCYEAGEEVHTVFAGVDGARVGKRNLDLGAVATQRLREAGVERVHDSGLCTMCAPELFFSHRRDDGVTGRQAGVAWRT